MPISKNRKKKKQNSFGLRKQDKRRKQLEEKHRIHSEKMKERRSTFLDYFIIGGSKK